MPFLLVQCFPGEIDYYASYEALLELPGKLEALDSIAGGSSVFWLTAFNDWIGSTSDPDVTSRVTKGLV